MPNYRWANMPTPIRSVKCLHSSLDEASHRCRMKIPAAVRRRFPSLSPSSNGGSPCKSVPLQEWNRSQASEHRLMNLSFFLCLVSGLSLSHRPSVHIASVSLLRSSCILLRPSCCGLMSRSNSSLSLLLPLPDLWISVLDAEPDWTARCSRVLLLGMGDGGVGGWWPP